jgi:hypothetical protein
MPEYDWVVCQEQQLTKNEYHNLLGEAKVVWSANLQETLGISWYEGAVVDAIPLVPDRLSYSEMAFEEFKYPSEWTESYDTYLEHKDEIIKKIRWAVEHHSTYQQRLQEQVEFLEKEYFSAKGLLANIE